MGLFSCPKEAVSYTHLDVYKRQDSDFALRLYKFNDWFDRYLPKHRYIVEEIESPVSYTHLDVYKRQFFRKAITSCKLINVALQSWCYVYCFCDFLFAFGKWGST